MHTITKTSTIVFLAIAFMASFAGAQTKVKFKKAVLPQGATVTTARDSHSKTKQVFEMGERVQERSEDKKSKQITIFNVLAANDKGITKAKVTFKTMKETKKSVPAHGDMEDGKDLSLAGKTFALDCTSGTLVAKNSDGTDVTNDELTTLEKEFAAGLHDGILFNPYGGMDQIIGAREMAVGEEVEVNKKATRRLLGISDPKNNFGSMKLTLRKKKRVLGIPCAIFDVKLNIDSSEIEAKGLKVSSDIKGQLVLALDTLWVQSVKVKGPVNASGEIDSGHGSAKVALDGSVDIVSMIVVQKNRKQ